MIYEVGRTRLGAHGAARRSLQANRRRRAMDRRDLMKSGLCLVGGACICYGQGSVAGMTSDGTASKIRTNPDLKKKTFPLKLQPFWMAAYDSRLYWLKSMLERLGRDTAVETWKAAFKTPDDGLLESIVAEGWKPYSEDEEPSRSVEELLEAHFAAPVEGVSKAEAQSLVELDPAIGIPKKRFPSLTVQKEINTYASLHMRADGIARIAETLIDRLGKQGELVAYDIIRAARAEAAAKRPREAADVMKEWTGLIDSDERNAFTSGLDLVLVQASDTEIIMHVKACEWARYFTERHPKVAYLVSCSSDDADLRATNDRLRMQRTSTIMEGGEVCDFRVYAV
jgi:hypothetical protein